jgi:hypothetical protein
MADSDLKFNEFGGKPLSRLREKWTQLDSSLRDQSAAGREGPAQVCKEGCLCQGGLVQIVSVLFFYKGFFNSFYCFSRQRRSVIVLVFQTEVATIALVPGWSPCQIPHFFDK